MDVFARSQHKSGATTGQRPGTAHEYLSMSPLTAHPRAMSTVTHPLAQTNTQRLQDALDEAAQRSVRLSPGRPSYTTDCHLHTQEVDKVAVAKEHALAQQLRRAVQTHEEQVRTT